MPKLLAEFLQEQQEPFVLDLYLLERGCSRGRSHDASSNNPNCTRFLKKRRHTIPNCSDFVKAVFSRLLLHNNQKIKKNGNEGRTSTGESREEHADAEDKFSSASGTTVYNSCSEGDVEDAQCLEADITSQSSENENLEAEADRKFKWRSMADGNKQLRTESDDEGSPLLEKQYEGESSTSLSQCKSKQQTQNGVQELQEFVDSNLYAQYIINKRSLQQTKQLLIDCVREVIEIVRKRDDKNLQELKKILGADELWKLVCENVWLWSQEPIDETKIVHLLHYDYMASREEWNSASEQQREETSRVIGEAILDGIINEIVAS